MKTNNQKINYENINVETQSLVKALNKVPGLTVTSSCYEHKKSPPTIFLYFKSIKKLNRFLWAMCYRFGIISTKISTDNWHLIIDNADTNYHSKKIRLALTGKKEMKQIDCDDLAKGIEEFVAYTKSGKKTKTI